MDFMKNFNEIEVTNPYLSLPSLCYTEVKPTPLREPYLIHYNRDLANKLKIDISKEITKITNGELFFKDANPFAMCYAGHQFGYFVNRLGDGRAINIGTIEKIHLQLKGAGATEYSRMGDGRAVLRSSIREYLISEAMNGLGVETSRALAIIGSKQQVIRETWESSAIVLRTSPSWVRFGTFEYFSNNKKEKELKELLDYAIEESYPHLKDEKHKYIHFFSEIVGKTARLMAKWQSIGFNHGVMNTDNMSIAGLTIDYGPFAFLDDYDLNYICNHTDQYGRYSFGNQPTIGQWNLQALMNALTLIVPKEPLEKVWLNYGKLYREYYLYLLKEKLGLDKLDSLDPKLFTSLFTTMQELQVDYTLFFRNLSNYNGDKESILKLCLYHKPMIEWLNKYDTRLELNSSTTKERQEKMLKVNPKYILRNYLIQKAIDLAQKNDFSLVDRLFKIAQTPFDEHKEFEDFAKATPEEFKNKKLSCSS